MFTQDDVEHLANQLPQQSMDINLQIAAAILDERQRCLNVCRDQSNRLRRLKDAFTDKEISLDLEEQAIQVDICAMHIRNPNAADWKNQTTTGDKKSIN